MTSMHFRHFRFSMIIVAGLGVAAPLPAYAQLAVTTNTVHERAARPGDRYEGIIEIRNTTGQAQEARIYQTDYQTTADGRSEFGDAGRHPRSNARWITVSPARVIVPPNGRSVVNYSVAVPAAGVRAGTSWSIVMVEALSQTALEAVRPAGAPARAQATIEPRVRFGIQIATHVGEAPPMKIAFDSVRATVDSTGSRELAYDFVNTGNRAVRLVMAVELFNADGRSVRRLEQQRGLLYPGTSARQRFRFGTLPPGEYRALVTADAGGDEMLGAQYTIRF